MNRLKNLRIVLVLLLLLTVSVVVRLAGTDRFKNDPGEAIAAMESGRNLISADELKHNENSFLLVNLDNDKLPDSISTGNSMQMPFPKLLEKSNRVKLDQAEKIVLYSRDDSKAARAWVILNQMKYRNVFILQTKSSDEELKYKLDIPSPKVRANR